ncbi:MAG: hypothetical protein VKJ64_10710 [Leptolyngbyaceae bacterium]|nr:hypothetical protein [Leptolyngbyaceae bacterium]
MVKGDPFPPDSTTARSPPFSYPKRSPFPIPPKRSPPSLAKRDRSFSLDSTTIAPFIHQQRSRHSPLTQLQRDRSLSITQFPLSANLISILTEVEG